MTDLKAIRRTSAIRVEIWPEDYEPERAWNLLRLRELRGHPLAKVSPGVQETILMYQHAIAGLRDGKYRRSR